MPVPKVSILERVDCIWKSAKVYTALLCMGHTFSKENIEDIIKLLESNFLNYCLKVTMTDLQKTGLKIKKEEMKFQRT